MVIASNLQFFSVPLPNGSQQTQNQDYSIVWEMIAVAVAIYK